MAGRPTVNVSLLDSTPIRPLHARPEPASAASAASSSAGVNTSIASSVRTSLSLDRDGAASTTGPPPLPSAANRVKVAVRLRPPFAEEGAVSAVTIVPPAPGAPPLHPGAPPRAKRLHLETEPGKAREFSYDVVYGASASNAEVYDDIAGPVVDGVLQGVNGTVLAYGQTGSGKTYSLGILSRVTGENGLVPRALSHLFGAVGAARAAAARTPPGAPPPLSHHITMSFLQIYLDGVHDLLSPAGVSLPAALAAGLSAAGGGGGNGARSGSGGSGALPLQGLPVREDPSRGFYVEGLSEFSVASFSDAVALLNWGLENRVLGATRMNATSSRSHTLLSLRVETRAPVALRGGGVTDEISEDGNAPATTSYGFTTQRSQLLLGDLAGSERVRRTSSRGVRLVEARAINASLHTLGQVIAALSAVSTANGTAAAARIHVPWRDSKLTRLLYGNLGGASNTYLLATVGPAPENAGESLSTLLFASRCMRVSASPVASQPHTQQDYAELAAALQARLDGSEAAHAAELEATRGRYEAALRDLGEELEEARRDAEAAHSQSGSVGGGAVASFSVSLSGGGGVVRSGGGAATASLGDAPPTPALAHLYSHLCDVFDAGAAAVWANAARHAEHGRAWARAIAAARTEGEAEQRTTSFAASPGASSPSSAASLQQQLPFSDAATAELRRVGLLPPAGPTDSGAAPSSPSRLGGGDGEGGASGSRPAAQAMQAVHLQHSSNSSFPAAGGGIGGGSGGSGVSSSSAATATNLLAPPAAPGPWPPGSSAASPPTYPHPHFDAFATVDALLAQCSLLGAACAHNAARLNQLCAAKDGRFDEVKRHLAAAEAALRLRDEDVQSQRYVLRYLVDTTAQLREDLRRARGKAAAVMSGEFLEEEGEEEGALVLPPPPLPPPPPPPPRHRVPSPPSTASSGGGSPGGSRSAFPTLLVPGAASASAAASRPPRPPAAPKPAVPQSHQQSALPTTTVSLLPALSGTRTVTSAVAGEEGEEEDEEDAVERILEQRTMPSSGGGGGQLLYRVRWRGAGPEEDEWFSREDLLHDFPHAVAEFERGGGAKRA